MNEKQKMLALTVLEYLRKLEESMKLEKNPKYEERVYSAFDIIDCIKYGIEQSLKATVME